VEYFEVDRKHVVDRIVDAHLAGVLERLARRQASGCGVQKADQHAGTGRRHGLELHLLVEQGHQRAGFEREGRSAATQHQCIGHRSTSWSGQSARGLKRRIEAHANAPQRPSRRLRGDQPLVRLTSAVLTCK
jgi:hypothetical protein